MSQNKNELKCKCGSTIFNVFKKSDCDSCRFNPDEGSQEHIDCDGFCEAGDSHGMGCINCFCAVCGELVSHIDFVDC